MNWEKWEKLPIGMIRLDELLNILHALSMTDCDQQALEIVAQATGLGEYFQPSQPRMTVELPVRQTTSQTK